MAGNDLRTDVRRLFDSIGMTPFGYRDLGGSERREDAVARWPLLASTNRAIDVLPAGRRHLREVPLARRVVAILSLSGGTGRTTVTANLAQSLAMSGHRVLGIDLDPQNQLGMHFGLDPNERVGMGHASLAVKDVTTFVGRQQGAAVLPFGLLGETALEQTEGRVLQDRNWLRMRVEAFTPADCGFVLLDVPAGRGPWMRQALAIADQVLVVLDPRPAAYASIPATELVLTEALGSEAAAEASYLLNAFDGRSSIQRDLQSGLRAALGDRVVPVTIQHDEAVAEALLHRRSLLHHAVDSQVTADFAQLAEWLQGRWGTSELEAGVAGRMAG